MPKLTKDFSLHLSANLYAIAEERRKALGLSMNAYVAKCIQLEKAEADQCGRCNYKAMFDSVLTTVGIALEHVKKEKR